MPPTLELCEQHLPDTYKILNPDLLLIYRDKKFPLHAARVLGSGWLHNLLQCHREENTSIPTDRITEIELPNIALVETQHCMELLQVFYFDQPQQYSNWIEQITLENCRGFLRLAN